MSRIFTCAAAAVLSLALTGCVSQEKYNALKLDRDGLAEQLGKAQTDASSARAEADSYKNQLAQLMSNGGNLQALVSNLQQQNSSLQSQYDELNRRYAEAMSRVGSGPALPVALNNALSDFAAQNPDLVDFDSDRGIVKFRSDVTFATGDATLTAKAKEAIARFATILNSPAANGYELMVAGHTDSTRVSNPQTIQKGHKNNWFLSAHRAISVADELMARRISPQRVAVVGYAEQRPVASNASESGRQQNRRVEILILPTQVRGTGVANIDPGSAVPMNKDSTANIDPALNK
jgi:chemotaxis protein MotB